MRKAALLLCLLAFGWGVACQPTQVPSEVPVELASQEPLSTERPADGSPSDASPQEAITEGGKEVSPDTPTQKPVQWSSCSLLTGKEGKEAECATIPLPLDWSDPQGKRIDVFIKRIRATSSQGQLWLLHGGPASSGQGVEAIVKPLLDTGKLPLDIYIIDHRGTGRSTRIGCPTQEAKDSPGGYSVTPDELKGCLAAIEKEWGKGFQQFTTTNAARDLYALINRTKGPNEPFFLFGVSYGTFWAHRFLQLYPKAPKGVVLDSLCMPGHCHQTRADDYSEETAIKLMSLCAKDPFCNQKLGPDPWKRTKEIFQKFEQGHCQLLQKSGFTKRYLSYMLASLMSDWKARMLIFPTLYRLDRCEVKDANAIAELANIVFAPPTSTGPPLSSQWYAMQVALSELKEDPAPTSDELRQRVKDHLITLQLTQSLLNIYDFWPRYPQDEYMGKWAKTSVPMLMLHGEIDPRTPLRIGEPAKQQFTSTNQHFVTIPNGTHGTLLQSPLGGGQLPCAMQITISFLKEPTQTPDKSCLPNILKLDFKGTPQDAQAIFKTNDYWD